MRLSPKIEAIAGGRLNSTRVDAGKVATTGTTSAFALKTDATVVATNARVLLNLDPAARWKAFAGASQGVRSPNLSDLTRFDIAEAGQIETPVSQLDPEKFLTGEIGVRAHLTRGGFEFAYYHTRIDRLIVRTSTGRIVSGLAEVTKRNSGEGYIHGVELEAHARLTDNLSVNGVVSWMKGSPCWRRRGREQSSGRKRLFHTRRRDDIVSLHENCFRRECAARESYRGLVAWFGGAVTFARRTRYA